MANKKKTISTAQIITKVRKIMELLAKYNSCCKKALRSVFVNRPRHHRWRRPPRLITALQPSVWDWQPQMDTWWSPGNLDCIQHKTALADKVPPFCDLSTVFGFTVCQYFYYLHSRASANTCYALGVLKDETTTVVRLQPGLTWSQRHRQDHRLGFKGCWFEHWSNSASLTWL